MDGSAQRIAELEQDLADLRAREEIRAVLHRYARGIDRCDAEILKSVYHPDAIDVHGNAFSGNGHKFAEFITEQLRDAIYNHHAVTNELIELDGDAAFVESYFATVHRRRTDEGEVLDRRSEGRYLDVFSRRDGAWRIAHRRVVVEALATSKVEGDDTLDLAPGQRRMPSELRPTTDRSDPVYRGFKIAEIQPAAYRGIQQPRA